MSSAHNYICRKQAQAKRSPRSAQQPTGPRRPPGHSTTHKQSSSNTCSSKNEVPAIHAQDTCMCESNKRPHVTKHSSCAKIWPHSSQSHRGVAEPFRIPLSHPIHRATNARHQYSPRSDKHNNCSSESVWLHANTANMLSASKSWCVVVCESNKRTPSYQTQIVGHGWAGERATYKAEATYYRLNSHPLIFNIFCRHRKVLGAHSGQWEGK